MKRCPKCNNETFNVTAHIVQGWEVDSDGDFVEITEDCVEVAHEPDNDDLWTCTECYYEAAGSEFEVKEISPEDKLNAVKHEQLSYIAASGGVLEIRESDDKYNDYNREIIKKFQDAHGSAFLGNINFYGEQRERVAEGKESVYEEYTGQPIYNASFSFVVPEKDEKLETAIRAWNGGAGKADVNKIFARIEELKGISFIWY